METSMRADEQYGEAPHGSLVQFSNVFECTEVLIKACDLYITLFEEFPALIWRAGPDAKCDYFNKTWLAFTGRTMEQELGDGWTEGVHPEDLNRCVTTYLQAFNARQPFEMEYRLRRHDGEYRWVTDYGRAFYDLDGIFAGYLGSCYDITERKRMEEALRAAEARYRDIVENASDIIYQHDLQGNLISINKTAERLTGYMRHEMIGRSVAQFVAPEHLPRIQQAPTEATGKPYELEIICKNGARLPVEINARPVYEGDRLVAIEGIAREITERKRAEEVLKELAYYDPLTNLPNRLYYHDCLRSSIARALHQGRSVALLFLDLDHFKTINDTLGHYVGDLLLQAVAQRLVHCVRESDTVARMGGDEFTVILPDVADIREVAEIAHRILDTLAAVFVLEGHELFVTASIGISLCPDNGQDAETLLKQADTAMYRAKEATRNTYRFYAPTMNAVAHRRLELEQYLRRALERNEFELFYQPKVCLNTGQMVGMEALVRWHHPELGLILPSEFIPVAEDTGLVEPIGKWALWTACAQNRAWQTAGQPPMRIAVNLSARQLQQADLQKQVADILHETGLEPCYLELEVMESMLIHHPRRALKLLRSLKEMGVRISLDDFGTGYSSLSYLSRLPIDTLKIDKSFVQNLTTDPNNTVVAAAVIALAHSLSLSVTAEGVETSEQLAFLRQYCCDELQGNLVGEPVPADEFAKFFAIDQAVLLDKVPEECLR